MQSPPPGPSPTYPSYQPPPHHGLSSPPPGNPYPHPSHAASAPANVQSGGPCPAPPRWVPHWSEQDRRWYYVETTGRSEWDAPAGLPPLPAMPGFSAHGSREGHQAPGGYPAPGGYHQGAPVYAPMNPQAPPGDSRKPSSNTMLAAAGGFAAGGVVGYFTHDVLGKPQQVPRLPFPLSLPLRPYSPFLPPFLLTPSPSLTTPSQTSARRRSATARSPPTSPTSPSIPP